MHDIAQELHSTASTLEAFSSIRVFEGISPRGLEQIASLAHLRGYDKDEYIFKEGDLGNSLFVVLRGKVRISREMSGMGEEALAVLEKGAAFGEMALIDAFPRSADAKAHETCEVLSITKEDFEELLLLNRDLASEILWNFVRMLSSRLRETNDKMAFLTATARF